MIGRLCSFPTWFLRFCIYKLIFIDSKHETCNKILDLEQVSVSAYTYFQLIYVLFSLYLEFSFSSPFLPHRLFLSVNSINSHCLTLKFSINSMCFFIYFSHFHCYDFLYWLALFQAICWNSFACDFSATTLSFYKVDTCLINISVVVCFSWCLDNIAIFGRFCTNIANTKCY